MLKIVVEWKAELGFKKRNWASKRGVKLAYENKETNKNWLIGVKKIKKMWKMNKKDNVE